MISSQVMSQHILEFIRGIGVVRDGVADPTSLSGPWTWAVPNDTSRLIVEMTGAGSGGNGGGNATGNTSVGGGSGGCSGAVICGEVSVVPSSTLTMTVGAGGTGGAIGSTGTGGGTSQITGIIGAFVDGVAGRLKTFNVRNDITPSAGSGANGTVGRGGSAGGVSDSNYDNGGTTSSAGGTPGRINTQQVITSSLPTMLGSNTLFTTMWGGSGGAAGNVSGAVAGGTNQYNISKGTGKNSVDNVNAGISSFGNTTGTVSRGAGGQGAVSFFGQGGDGGDGGQAGFVGKGYGVGGGGGGGDAAGANGSDGYIRITYWSAQ